MLFDDPDETVSKWAGRRHCKYENTNVLPYGGNISYDTQVARLWAEYWLTFYHIFARTFRARKMKLIF